jgi:tetratricopeptide (TPR) repeat protein
MSNRFHRLELGDSQQQAQSVRTTSSALSPQLAALHDSPYWMRQADQSRRQGQFEEALRQYSRAVELDRAAVVCWVGQVQMLIAMGEYPEAELWARKALELFRNHADLTAARAQATCRDGKIKESLAICDAALAQPGESAYRWIARGDVMLARKDSVEQHCFDKAAQIDPDWLVLIEIAAIYAFYHRHAKALTRCRQAVEKAPDEPYAWYQRARSERAMGLIGPAKQSYRQCLDLQPKHSPARLELLQMDSVRGSIFRRLLRRLFARG